ncbi:hypothetical protein E9993_19825 [Labilibacter sediminis]|nr:hypothetical protein E9993_19825 [Labilibacter sediminis]
MNNDLINIKEKVINNITIISAFFIGFPYVLSILRMIRIGWDFAFVWHTVVYAIVIILSIFRHRIALLTKVIAMATVYTVIAIASLYKFSFFGAYYFVFIGIAILVILHGFKVALYYIGLFTLIYVFIAVQYILGYLQVELPPQDHTTSVFSWVAILVILLSLSLVIIKGFGQFYSELIVIIQKKEKTEIELEKHKEQLERRVSERTTELQQTIHMLKETQAQLLQAEKMASLGVLTAGVSHEINNPLNYILGGYTGLVQYFRDNEVNDETVTVLLDSIKAGVDRSSKIVSGLNEFSRQKETFDEQCNIHEIMDNCLLMINNQLQNKIEVRKNYSNENPHIIGNIGKMHQVFLNIFTNAYQSIKDNGSITITTKTKEDMCYIEVSDTGIGIRKDDLPKVMDPFFTTKDPGMGTGLGLSITYSIVKEHGGNLEIESEQNKGTTVKISIPH